MTFTQAARAGFITRPFTFSGRASRAEFWWVFAVATAAGIALGAALDSVWPRPPVSLRLSDAVAGLSEAMLGASALAWALVAAFVFLSLATWSAWARRMHDRGRRAIWIAPANLLALASAMPGTEGLLFALVIEADPDRNFGEAFFDPAGADTFRLPQEAAMAILVALAMIAVIGLVQLALMAGPGTDGPNRYGPDPRTPKVDADVFA